MIDDYLREAVANGVDAVLNLGAGLDTRPYRLELPPTFPWVEVDLPHLIEFGNRRCATRCPRCRLQRVGVNLADAGSGAPSGVGAAGFTPRAGADGRRGALPHAGAGRRAGGRTEAAVALRVLDRRVLRATCVPLPAADRAFQSHAQCALPVLSTGLAGVLRAAWLAEARHPLWTGCG
ncbi:MAG: class I SAM-dependent methyltransferase [Proteobacteria bacterium]|nr:class I SAM-dependent methyltransferase [Pseudomonadota bacterium]